MPRPRPEDEELTEDVEFTTDIDTEGNIIRRGEFVMRERQGRPGTGRYYRERQRQLIEQREAASRARQPAARAAATAQRLGNAVRRAAGRG